MILEKIFEDLPDTIRSNILPNYNVGKRTTVKIGGNCDYYYYVSNLSDLTEFVKCIPPEIGYAILGKGSNVIVRDVGLRKPVISLGGEFTKIQWDGSRIIVGGGYPDNNLWKEAQRRGVGGFEFLVGIPGTIGGAVKMNAGIPCYEISDIFIEAQILKSDGSIVTMDKDSMKFAYRSSALKDNDIVLNATFQSVGKSQSEIDEFIEERQYHRNNFAPVGTKTAGSTFKNPSEEKRAWKLIEDIGYKGKALSRNSNVWMDETHCNYLNVREGCSTIECENLINKIKKIVLEKHDINLQLEVKFWGG